MFSLAMAWLAMGCAMRPPGSKLALVWVLVFHVGANVGWIYFAPTVVTLFTRAAPLAVTSTMVGVSYLSITIGSTFSGHLGALYEHYSAASFWLLHAVIAGCGSLLLFLLTPWLKRELQLQLKAPARQS
jgi:POT family proton-dependent oligopeptide transporter